MLLSQKFNLRSMNPMEGGLSGFWMSATPTEVANAVQSGSGPGVPDTNGTPTPGTVHPGMIMVINTSGTLDPAVSPNLSVGGTLPILPFVVFSGDDDFSGSVVGDCLIVHGPGRFDTQQFDAGVYTPGLFLIASAATPGNLAPKVIGDDKQIIGQVGPRGLSQSGGFGATSNVLDAILVQGITGLIV